MVTFLVLDGSPACLLVPHLSHGELFLKLQNEEVSRQYLARHWPLGNLQEEEWLRKANTTDTDAVFTVALHPKQKPVGTMGLHRIHWKDRRATTGSVLLERHCNKGVGTAAKMLLLNWAFNELGLNKIESRVIAFNGRSQAYSKKCGYKEVGRLKRHILRHGQWHDEVILEVHNDDWQPLWDQFKKECHKRTSKKS